MIFQVMCLHIYYWGSMHTHSRHNGVSYWVYRSNCFQYAHNDINMDNGTLNDRQNGVGFGVSIPKSRTEFVSYVLETHQHYNCGHYQGKQLNHTKESGL